MSVVKVEGLRKVYGSGALAVVALDSIDLEVGPGELLALLGPSGSGKSTMLFCISLIVEPTAGRVWIEDQLVYDNGTYHVDPRSFRRRNLGFIFQSSTLIPFLSARDNVAIAIELDGGSRRDARKRALDLLDSLEVAHRANAMPGELSGGEQQRVAIARALANEPPLIFADEPTASLDTERGFMVMALLRGIAKQHRTGIIVVTHDERMIAGFDSVRRMRDGRFVEASDPRGVISTARGDHAGGGQLLIAGK